MNRLIRYLQNYLIIGLPFVVLVILWSSLSPTSIEHARNYSFLAKMIWNGLGMNTMFWFCMLTVYLLALVFIPSLRDKTLQRLANMKERDEREEYITGKASRRAYISTLSIIIFFLFFSLFSFNLTSMPKDAEGHHLRASVGLHFTFLNNESKKIVPKNSEQILFDTERYTPSSSTILLILLAWQLFVFNRAAKREQE